MPNVGSLVRLFDGTIAIVTRVTPLGDGGRVQRFARAIEEPVAIDDIAEVLHEPEAAA